MNCLVLIREISHLIITDTMNILYNPAAIKFQCILHGYILQCSFSLDKNHKGKQRIKEKKQKKLSN